MPYYILELIRVLPIDNTTQYDNYVDRSSNNSNNNKTQKEKEKLIIPIQVIILSHFMFDHTTSMYPFTVLLCWQWLQWSSNLQFHYERNMIIGSSSSSSINSSPISIRNNDSNSSNNYGSTVLLMTKVAATFIPITVRRNNTINIDWVQ